MNDTVHYEVADGIATITLNRPKALNALNDEMREALLEATARAEVDERARCVVVRGAGDSFMAGGDVKRFYEQRESDSFATRRRFLEGINHIHPICFALRRMPKPVLASVHGYAAGFGLSLALACDLAIAADTAKFTLAYVRIGTSPDGSASYTLPRAVGLKKAMEMALLGDDMDAATAQAHGLINFVAPQAELAAETQKLAARLASGPTRAYANVKRLIWASQDNGYESQLQLEAECFADNAVNGDFAEGVAAFAEKRKPQFKGR